MTGSVPEPDTLVGSVEMLPAGHYLTWREGRIELTKYWEAAFGDSAVIAPGTQVIRTSTGIELQVLMPVFNQPFRIYWAFNPTRVQEFLQPPIVADRSYFPNQASFINSILTFGQPQPLFEKRSQFRFTIGRTF